MVVTIRCHVAEPADSAPTIQMDWASHVWKRYPTDLRRSGFERLARHRMTDVLVGSAPVPDPPPKSSRSHGRPETSASLAEVTRPGARTRSGEDGRR
jgi:hypothetical protein